MVHHQKSECPVEKKWITTLRIKVTAQGQNVNVCPDDIFCITKPFVSETWDCDATLWVRVSCKKIYLLFSRSRSLQELIWTKYDHFYRIFWTAGPFATKRGLMVHYHKPECFTVNWIVVFKVKVTAKFPDVSVLLFAESLKLLLPNLVWWCVIMSQIVFQKDWFAVVQGESHSQE